MKSLLRLAAFALVLAAGLFLSPALEAQAPPGALAWTECLGGHVSTYVNAEIVGSDSLREILVHEAKHREQAHRAGPGQCPVVDTPWKLLAAEVEAYCASKPFHMARLPNPETAELETDVNYLTRLFIQFHGAMLKRDIVQAYRTGCPDHGVLTMDPNAIPQNLNAGASRP